MRTIVIVPSDVPSKRMLADRLGNLLRDAGHRVVMLLDAGEAVAVATQFEQRHVPLRMHVDPVVPWRPLSQWHACRSAASQLDPAALDSVLVELAPELVIIDIEEYEALILALASPTRPPVAVLCSFFEIWPISGLGPNDPGPVGGPIDRIRSNLRWPWMRFRFRVRVVRRQLVSGRVDRTSTSRMLAWRQHVRRQFTVRQWLRPFAPRSLPMIVCNALELDLPHNPRRGVVHVGSLLDPVEPDAVDAIADRRLALFVARSRSAGRPLVVCAFGTLATGNHEALVQRVAGLALCRPDVAFVVGIDDSAFAPLPNVYSSAWIPQRELLTVADAAFVHTGNATLHECVAAGVPMLVHPFAVNDQPRNAARVVRHGIGTLDDGRRGEAEWLAERLDEVLADHAMRRRISKLAEQVTRYEREGVAVAAIEDLIRSAVGSDH